MTIVIISCVLMNLLFSVVIEKVGALGCFKCVSFNGTDDDCSDPYHSLRSTYSFDCFAGRPGRTGTFPSHFCYKIKGTQTHSNGQFELYVRDCSAEDMGNMCGQFEYLGRRMNGCILTCTTDGCNIGARLFQACISYRCLTVFVYFLWKENYFLK